MKSVPRWNQLMNVLWLICFAGSMIIIIMGEKSPIRDTDIALNMENGHIVWHGSGLPFLIFTAVFFAINIYQLYVLVREYKSKEGFTNPSWLLLIPLGLVVNMLMFYFAAMAFLLSFESLG